MAPARPIRSAVLATALYLAGALWSVRAILPAPASTLAHVPVFGEQLVPADDEYMVVWQETRNAHALLTAPGRLVDTGQCYPFARALTLGEHMLGEAVLGVIPYWATREPLFTHNAVATAMVWIAAVAMWVLVFYWTRSASAALVAGFLFGFYPTRIGDTGHPFVNGNQWTPLALLFAHRLFVRRRWIDAAGLACFTGLQTLESFYPLVAFAIIGGVYGLYLVTRNLRTLPSLLQSSRPSWP